VASGVRARRVGEELEDAHGTRDGEEKMTPEFLAQEKIRFNALSQEEALRIGQECEGARPGVRSCWYCNGAHEHLKDMDYFTCFACGINYARGYPVKILGMRMRGEEVTDEEMAKFAEALADED
jgi:hypothetical protein